MYAEAQGSLNSGFSTTTHMAAVSLPGAVITQKLASEFFQIGASVPGRLKSVQISGTDHTVTDLGPGRSPRLGPGKVFVALAPNGLITINPATGTRTILIPRTGADDMGNAISTTGRLVALAASGKLDIYSMWNTNPVELALIGILPDPHSLPVAFIDATHFMLVTSNNAGSLYQISPSTGKVLSFVTHLVLTNPIQL